jgi:hypothetical protein
MASADGEVFLRRSLEERRLLYPPAQRGGGGIRGPRLRRTAKEGARRTPRVHFLQPASWESGNLILRGDPQGGMGAGLGGGEASRFAEADLGGSDPELGTGGRGRGGRGQLRQRRERQASGRADWSLLRLSCCHGWVAEAARPFSPLSRHWYFESSMRDNGSGMQSPVVAGDRVVGSHNSKSARRGSSSGAARRSPPISTVKGRDRRGAPGP